MSRIHRLSPFALLVLAAGCHVPLAENVRYADPDAPDRYGSCAIGTFELREAARRLSESLRERMPASEGHPWRIRLDRLTTDELSYHLSPELVQGEFVQRINASCRDRVEMFLPQAESRAEDLGEDQKKGRRAGEVPAPPLLMPDFLLTGTIQEIVATTTFGRSRYHQFTLQLTDLQGRLIWFDIYAIKKEEHRDPIYS